MVWNSENESLADKNALYRELADCDILIVRETVSGANRLPDLHTVDVLKTEETIITKFLMNYLQAVLHKESDTCCCP
jgi:hypothetical protein